MILNTYCILVYKQALIKRTNQAFDEALNDEYPAKSEIEYCIAIIVHKHIC